MGHIAEGMPISKEIAMGGSIIIRATAETHIEVEITHPENTTAGIIIVVIIAEETTVIRGLRIIVEITTKDMTEETPGHSFNREIGSMINEVDLMEGNRSNMDKIVYFYG